MEQTFSLNSRSYKTDAETLELLRSFRNNSEMFGFVFEAGMAFGSIEEVTA